MAEYRDTLVYEVKIEDADLDAITDRVAKATAKGVDIGSGGSGPGGSGGSGGASGSSSGGGDGGAFGKLRRSVVNLTQAIASLTEKIGKIGNYGGGGGSSQFRKKTEPRMSYDDLRSLYYKTIADLYKKSQPPPLPKSAKVKPKQSMLQSILGVNAGEGTPFGQALRGGFAGMGRRGYGGMFGGGAMGRFASYFLGNLPSMPIGAYGAMKKSAAAGVPGAAQAYSGMMGTVKGAAMRGLGGALMGPAGAAMAGNPAGLIVQGIMMQIKNLGAAFEHLGQSASQLFKGSITANASTALHGLTSAAQASARMMGGPILGAAMDKMIGVFHKFIDAMDAMVDNLGKYNAATAAAMGRYEAQQIMFQVELSNLLEPLMTWWVELKSAILDGLMNVLRKLIPTFQVIFELIKAYVKPMQMLVEILYKFSAIGILLDMLFETVKDMIKSMVGLAYYLLDLIPNRVLKTLGLDGLKDSLKKLKDALDDTADGVQKTGARDKLLAPIGGAKPHNPIAGTGRAVPKPHAPQLGQGGFRRQKNRHGLPSAIPPNAPVQEDESAPPDPKKPKKPDPNDPAIPAKPPLTVDPLVFKPQGFNGIDFSNNIEMQNTFNVSTEKAIFDTVDRLRGELALATRAQQADSRLALAMLGASITMGDGL